MLWEKLKCFTTKSSRYKDEKFVRHIISCFNQKNALQFATQAVGEWPPVTITYQHQHQCLRHICSSSLLGNLLESWLTQFNSHVTRNSKHLLFSFAEPGKIQRWWWNDKSLHLLLASVHGSLTSHLQKSKPAVLS